MICKSLHEAAEEVLAHPASKTVTLTKDYRLLLKGSDKQEAKDYIISTPLGVVASISDFLWYPKGQKLKPPAKVGIVSPDSLLILDAPPKRNVYYWNQGSCPETPIHFILFAEFEDFADAYIATPTIGKPIYFRWPSQKSRQLRGLCSSLIALNSLEIMDHLGAFLLKASFYQHDDDEWDM